MSPSQPTFVPHPLSSNMNPGEPVQCRCVCESAKAWVTVLLVLRGLLYNLVHTSLSLNVSPLRCMHGQTHLRSTLPEVRAPCPEGAARGQAFVEKEGPRGAQRASQTHGGLWPFVFLMALSHFIIDFNSAMCHARENEAFMIRRRPEQQDVAQVQEQWLRWEVGRA